MTGKETEITDYYQELEKEGFEPGSNWKLVGEFGGSGKLFVSEDKKSFKFTLPSGLKGEMINLERELDDLDEEILLENLQLQFSGMNKWCGLP